MEKSSHSNPPGEYDNFAFHPWNVMLVLLLFAVTLLFVALSVSFVYLRVEHGAGNIKLPWLFALNTLILLATSWLMLRAKKFYLSDDTESYQNSLRWTIRLTLVFLVMQTAAWWLLFRQNVFLDSDNSAAILYLLSGLHFAHVIAGLPFLFLFLRAAKRQMKEPVTVLVYFSDPDKRLKLRLLSIYWHFLDGLWIFLVLFFIANYWLR